MPRSCSNGSVISSNWPAYARYATSASVPVRLVFSFFRSSRLVIDDPPSLTISTLTSGMRASAVWRSLALVRESRKEVFDAAVVSFVAAHDQPTRHRPATNIRNIMERKILTACIFRLQIPNTTRPPILQGECDDHDTHSVERARRHLRPGSFLERPRGRRASVESAEPSWIRPERSFQG